MAYGDIRDDWRIAAVEKDAADAKRRLHELDTLSRDVARLERENGEIRARADGLRATCEALLSRIEALEVTP